MSYETTKQEIDAAEFELISRGLSAKVIGIATRVLSENGYYGIDACADAPSTYEELCVQVGEDRLHGNRLFKVWNGASDRTIYQNPVANFAARAWHDLMHVTKEMDFGDKNETDIGFMQCLEPSLTKIESMCVYFDVAGQCVHKTLFGDFPVDQRGFVIACLNAGRTVHTKF